MSDQNKVRKVAGFGIDLETTDIDEKSGDIIEIAVVAFDEEFQEIDSIEVLINPCCWRDISEFSGSKEALEMHDKTGLIDDVINEGLPQYEAVMKVEDFMNKHREFSDQKFPLMGSSVQFDRTWMAHHTPGLLKFFSYRNMDASSVYEMCVAADHTGTVKDVIRAKLKASVEAEVPAGKAHRALYDIRKSLTYWRYYSQWLIAGYSSLEGFER